MNRSIRIARLPSLFFSLTLAIGFGFKAASGQVQYRAEKSYEDTVRIVVLTNESATGNGYCPVGTDSVGIKTRDFVKKSIITVPNVKYMNAVTTTWNDITQIKWDNKPLGTLPHAIVHINAGWTSLSGPNVYGILDRAADLKIGVVSIGDDAAALAQNVFGFVNTNNVPAPMNDARQFVGNNSHLWIALDTKDTLPSPGVTRNTRDSLSKNILQFKPYPGDNVKTPGNYRCQEDADAYSVAPAFQNQLQFLGFQRGLLAGATDTVKTGAASDGKVVPLQVIVAFQDSLRRGVALSYQPQFLLDETAAHQIDYDAIIYASFAHLFHLKVSTPVADKPSQNFPTELPVFLSVSDPSDATIYYTLDGSTPDSGSTKYVKGQSLNFDATTTLKAIAYKAGWTKSDVATYTYTKVYTPSKIEVLDKDGNQLFGGYLSEQYDSYLLRITTFQGGLTQVQPTANAAKSGDKETFTISAHHNDGDALVYEVLVPFHTSSAAASGDGATQASTYDTLLAAWNNPKNPADHPSIPVPVRPKINVGDIHFSTKPDGSDRVEQYVGTETKIYVVVVDEVLPAGKPPTVTLTTKPFVAGAGDAETLTTFTSPTPGTYVFAVDVIPGGTSGDGKVRLALNDQMTAVYQDPLDATEDPVTANAGYGIAPLITANLQFTDSLWNAIPDGVKYSPENSRLYVQLTDDWAAGKFDSIPVGLAIINYENKATKDTETVWVKVASHTGSTGVWRGSISLKDYRNIVPLNKIAETYVLGDVTGSAVPHDNSGNLEGAPVKDHIQVAYKDLTPTITIDGPGGTTVTRADTGLVISIVDQSLSSGKDTLYVDLSCGVSGDKVVHTMVIEDPSNPGHYKSVVIGKTEGNANLSDNILTCKDQDHIKVSYTDPVYKTETIKTVDISEPVTAQLFYTSDPGGNLKIQSVLEGDTNSFYAVLLATDPNITQVDSFTVTIKTDVGDVETFVAKETGVHTNKFIVKVPFAFVTGNVATNSKVEGKILAGNIQNRVTATGTVVVNHEEKSATISLVAAIDPVLKAYIKDLDGDGKADHVYIQFAKTLPRLPTSVDSRWNLTDSPVKTGTSFSFLNDDHTVLVVDYSANPFDLGATSIPDGQNPSVTLPDDALFANQKKNIEDSIGPALISAVKIPAGPGTSIDTLKIVVSEPIQSSGDLKQMLKFSLVCGDRTDAHYVQAYTTPTPDANDPTHYTILVDNTVTWVEVGRCLWLDDAGPITDSKLNVAVGHGVELVGKDQVSAIRGLRGFPPVAGMDPTMGSYQVSTNDSRDSTTGFADAGGVINWIPPVEYSSQGPSVENGNQRFQPYVPVSGQVGPADNTRPGPLPKNISAVQVISTLAYTATVGIFDHYGNFMRSFTQYFGFQNEMTNPTRSIPGKGWASYIVWDLHDSKGRLAGQGVYIWKITFQFWSKLPDNTLTASSQKQEIRYVRTGVMRRAGEK